MKSGDMVTYSPSGPLGHILGGCPGRLGGIGPRFAIVTFAASQQTCQLEDLAPAVLWWRRGLGRWQGPFATWADAMASLSGAGVDPAPFASGETCPLGAEIISGGFRYRLAWGGVDPPSRYG